MGKLAQAFAGKIIENLYESERGHDPQSFITNNGSDTIGACGTNKFCISSYENCYLCPKFRPLLNGPHQEILDKLYKEKEERFKKTKNIDYASSKDRIILAVEYVVQACNEMKRVRENINMNNPIFTPIHNNPELNLAKFIDFCKNRLTAFGNDCWENNQWKAKFGIYSVQVRFSTDRIKSTAYKYEPLSEPFIDFAKAYILYTYSLQPIRQLARHIEALRLVEMALYNVKSSADILLLDYLVIREVESLSMKKYEKGSDSINKLGYQLEKLFDFCRINYITPNLPIWNNPYKRPRDLTILLDEKGKEYRSQKMPTDEEMMSVAKLFHDAPNLDKETEYYTAIMALLMVAPSRYSELMSLSINCLEWEEDSLGNKQLGIRWIPAKNGKEGLK